MPTYDGLATMTGNAGNGMVKISPMLTNSPVDFTIAYTPTTPTTGSVMVRVQALTGGAFSFISTGWTQVDAITREKEYFSNVEGEILAFTPNGDSNTQHDTVNLTRILPTASISYSTENPTTGMVAATISFHQSGVVVTNNGGNLTREFYGDGQFTFEFADARGNT